MSVSVQKLARRYGIMPRYRGLDGRAHRTPIATLRRLLASFGVAALSGADRDASFAVAPAAPPARLRGPEAIRCHMPDWLDRDRAWGVAIQLYQLRSGRNWGIGDFADLAQFARLAGACGADFVGVNPLHALFLADPRHCSPFSPSNRRFLNPLYLAVDDVPGFDPARAPAGALEALRAPELVDYPAVAAAKRAALRAIWRAGAADAAALDRFRAAGGAALHRHALFEAISERMVAEGRGAGWRDWPEDWRDHHSPAVTQFADREADAVAFHAWLQWLCDRQLSDARDAALRAGMRIGLYLDFAVGEAPDGSSTWSDRDLVLRGVRVGAPPDYFNAAGQDWGLAPLSPLKMAAARAAPFRALMDDATRRAGALRIDHAMALWQLFLIPRGATPADGAYVRYPIVEMIEALAEASRANGAIIIGEDLGNVPKGFRAVMDAAHILSYRILFFERDAERYIPPQNYPRNALVCLSTHDLPTFQGWWRGDDVALRARYGLIDAAAAEDQTRARIGERRDLAADLAAAGLFTAQVPAGDAPAALVVAVHRHLARAPSRLFAVRLEDLVGEREPVNLPSTSDEYPNWRRKLAATLEDLPRHPLFGEITAALREERPRTDAEM